MATSLEKQIIQLGDRRKISELKLLINKTPAQKLIDILEKRIGRSDVNNFWNWLLRGFDGNDDSVDKRFACVKTFLKQLNKVELSYKQTYDMITRLFLDLPSFPNDQLIEIVEYSIDSLKMGDAKCVGWKDLLPELINILANKTSLPVNGVRLTGTDYRSSVVKNLCTMKWPSTVVTPIANMFRDMKLGNEEIITVLTKFCYCFKGIEPLELPALTFQLFSMCNTASQIIIPIIALQRYFYKHYYKKLYADMESDSTDFNSIDAYSDKDLREAEETILHHLNYCTQYKISELQILTILRNFTSSPDVILTPFVLSAILSMARINRDPDNRLTSSAILPFLRNVITNNEDEKELLGVSAWCRDTLQTKQVNIEQIFMVLIDQNKEGKDVVTPGLVNLAFILLKAKNAPKLNALGITFLQKFVKKRFIFGQGIVKSIAEWMIIEQDANQYSECLTVLSMTDTFTVSECVSTIKYVLDFFLWIPGLHAMRMMSFILPVVKISHIVRDSFIDVLKKAMYSRESATCQLGVYGFCMLLKQLNNSNSQRATVKSGNMFTQQSISGFSLMSQTALGNRNNPQRHFDMLTLEIIGMLRNCFNQSLEIKVMLYESLIRAVDINPKLTSHILQFVDWHFRSYFNVDEMRCEIKFEKLIRHQSSNEKEIEITDNLGQLTNFVAFCVMNCDKHELNYDTSVLRQLFSQLMEKVCSKDLDQLQITGTITQKMNQIALQFVSLLEALMNYALWTSDPSNNNVQIIYNLFKHRFKICNEVKDMIGHQSKKVVKKVKMTESNSHTQNVTINGTLMKRIIFKPENISNLPTAERFLRLLHDDYVSFTESSISQPLRSDRDLVRFVTQTAITLIENLRSESEYKQITHSRRCLKNLVEISKLVYEKCIKRLPDLWNNFDVTTAYLSAECFRQTLITADSVFKRKFDAFLKGVDFEFDRNDDSKKIIAIVQGTIEASIKDGNGLEDEPDGQKIAVVLLQCLEILCEFISYDDKLCMPSYFWIFKFCQTHELKTKELAIANKILFAQRMRTHTGAFFTTIAIHLQNIFQKVDDEKDTETQFELKSITELVAEPTLNHLMNVIRKQISAVEYFITKARSIHAKMKITSDDDRDQCIQYLKTTEKSICSQLIHISNTLLRMTNTCIPLGTFMDSLIRILMENYLCLTNLTKHFIVRHASISVSFQGTKFDQLLRVCGKPLSANIYNLITHIEANIFEGSSKRKHDPQADKARVLKETKFLPKLVLRMETFNKFVIMLSKKTDSHLVHYLHIGTVRDFRIKTSELKDAIDKTLSHSSQISNDEDNEIMVDANDNQSEIENEMLEEMQSVIENNEPGEVWPASGESTHGIILAESNNESDTQVLKNLAKVNAEIRKQRSSDIPDKTGPAPKKRNTRKTKN